MTTYLGKSCSFCLPRVPFVNCRQFMHLVISLLVLRAGYGIWLYQFLIIAYLFTFYNAKSASKREPKCHTNLYYNKLTIISTLANTEAWGRINLCSGETHLISTIENCSRWLQENMVHVDVLYFLKPLKFTKSPIPPPKQNMVALLQLVLFIFFQNNNLKQKIDMLKAASHWQKAFSTHRNALTLTCIVAG